VEVGSGDYVVVVAAKVEIRRGQSADGISKVNGSNYSGAPGRKKVGLLSGSSGGVGGAVVVDDAGAGAAASTWCRRCCRRCCYRRI
jgi:hypothetical protein